MKSHPSQKNGSTGVVIESVEEGGKKTEEGLGEDDKTEEIEEDEGHKELVEVKSEGSEADGCKKDESADEGRVDIVTDSDEDVSKENQTIDSTISMFHMTYEK